MDPYPYDFRDGEEMIASGEQVMDNFAAARAAIEEIEAAMRGQLGVSDRAVARRGKCSIATDQSTTSMSFAHLATPDLVEGVRVPADGLIFVLYRALWRISGAVLAGEERIALDGDAAVAAAPNTVNGNPLVVSLRTDGAQYGPLFTSSASAVGLQVGSSPLVAPVGTPNAWSNGVTYGSAGVVGWSACVLEASAGDHDVSIQYRVSVSGGTLTVKDRLLRVWTMGF